MLNHHSFLSEKAIPLRTQGFTTRSSPALYHHLLVTYTTEHFYSDVDTVFIVQTPMTSNTFFVLIRGKKYSIKSFTNGKATCVMYIFKCPYGFVYVGQTKRAVRIRIVEHKAAIRNKKIWITPSHTITQGLIMVLRLLWNFGRLRKLMSQLSMKN